MKDLCEQNKYPHNLDVTEIFDIWEGHKFNDILTYRWVPKLFSLCWISNEISSCQYPFRCDCISGVQKKLSFLHFRLYQDYKE